VPEIGAALAPEIQRFRGLSLADDESRGRPNARPALTCSIEDRTILLSACHEMAEHTQREDSMKRRLIAALALGVFALTVAAPLVVASNAVAQSTM
jgi:hypothetical protein